MRTKISPKGGRGLGHVTPTIFGSTVGYLSNSLASCLSYLHELFVDLNKNCTEYIQGLIVSDNVTIRYSFQSMT